MEIYQQFKKREVMARTKYKGDFALSEDLKLGVQIFARTREETFPSMKKYSKVAGQSSSLDAGKVGLRRDYTELDDTDQNVVPPELHRKAYFYGKQLVPVSEENEAVLKGKIPKAKPD
jgi:hypothetical protein